MERWAAERGTGSYGGNDTHGPLGGQARALSKVEWEASEYIHHDKGAGWITVMISVALVLVALAVLFGQWTFAAILVVMAGTVGYYAFRKPGTINYKLDHTTLMIGNKEYPLSLYRAFGVVKEGAFYSIRLIPAKRFGLLQSAYVSPREGEAVVDILGSVMPMEEMQPDPIENLMNKLRF